MFRALTRVNADLRLEPDLASSWKSKDGDRTWVFELHPGQRDHSDQPIDPAAVAACLENYRRATGGNSALKKLRENWQSTRSDHRTVTVQFRNPSIYFPRESSLLRFFRIQGVDAPCAEAPQDAALIGSGAYRPSTWVASPDGDFALLPVGGPERPKLSFSFPQDVNTRLMRLLRGDFEVSLNGLPISKLEWLRRNHSDRFDFLDREGSPVSFLGFNLKNRFLNRREVRQAIAHALDREQIVRAKIGGITAGSLLPRGLPETVQTAYPYDLALAERLLDASGFRRGPDGIRFELKFKATPFRESQEMGVVFQKMLEAVGIRLRIESVEPAVFFASIRQGNFDLFTSRFLGVADGSLLYQVYRSGQPANRAGYSDPSLDVQLDAAMNEADEARRNAILRTVQARAAEDLPYLPLWYWPNTAILKKGLTGLTASELSLSGALEPLTRLRYSKNNETPALPADSPPRPQSSAE